MTQQFSRPQEYRHWSQLQEQARHHHMTIECHFCGNRYGIDACASGCEQCQQFCTPPRFSRPQAAREIEARARARQMGVRVEVVEPAMAYATKSQSEPGAVYTMTREREGWVCECKGFVFTGVCKHLGQLERRSEREGWTFGRIAPRPQMVA